MALLVVSGCLLQVKLSPQEGLAAARATLPPAYADWSNVEVTLRPRQWVVTFRNIKASAQDLGWDDADFPRGRSDNGRYRDATVYVDADTGAILRKELTP